MQFNDTSGLTGIIQTIEDLTDLGTAVISGDTSLMKKFTSYTNQENRDIWATIFESTGNWQYDDANQTNMPSGVTSLVNGTQSYALPTEALTIQRVEVADSSGQSYELQPITKEMVDDAMSEFHDTAGTPVYYRPVGNTIILYPAPNYDSSGGMRVYYDRDVIDFTTSDTTKTPGFASPFHRLLPLKVAIKWLNIKQPTNPSLAGYRAEEQKIEIKMKRFYGRRFKDLKPAISRRKENWK